MANTISNKAFMDLAGTSPDEAIARYKLPKADGPDFSILAGKIASAITGSNISLADLPTSTDKPSRQI